MLQLTKQGVSDSFLETFPLIVMYLHVILDPNAYNLCPWYETWLCNDSNTKNSLIIFVCGKYRHFIGFRFQFIVEYFTVQAEHCSRLQSCSVTADSSHYIVIVWQISSWRPGSSSQQQRHATMDFDWSDFSLIAMFYRLPPMKWEVIVEHLVEWYQKFYSTILAYWRWAHVLETYRGMK